MPNWYKQYQEDIRYKISYHCAPVILGLKAANTITLFTNELAPFLRSVSQLKTEHISLYQNKRLCVHFLFRRELLERRLKESSVLKVLEQFGYCNLTTDAMLKQLKKRYQEYMETGSHFPHEIGIFLNYPIQDVLGFMEKGGKNALLTGYWKVYGDVKKAENLFRHYDDAKERVLNFLEKGYELEESIYLLNNSRM